MVIKTTLGLFARQGVAIARVQMSDSATTIAKYANCAPFAIVVALSLICTLAMATPCRAKSPNVVLITIDTVRADHVGCYGDRQAHTPNLDALDRDGVHFLTTVASVPLTLPSHCS